MNLKSLTLTTILSQFGIWGAYAAEIQPGPDAEPAEYVKICDAYGAGYFYIPGTETCVRIHGYIRNATTGGDNVYATRASAVKADTWRSQTRFQFRFTTASHTDLGDLKTHTEIRYQWFNANDTTTFRFAYIQLGGLRVGLDESAFLTFTGYLGNVLSDDIILAGGYRTNLISYTFEPNKQFSAIFSLEQGGNSEANTDVTIDNYVPHIVGGVKWKGDSGSIAGVAAYDSRNETWAGKIRGDLKITDQFSIWLQGAYKSNHDRYAIANGEAYRKIDAFYGTWGGDWAFWGGLEYKASRKQTLNLQVSYDGTDNLAIVGTVPYQLTQGLRVTPEIAYVKWNDSNSSLDGKHALHGRVSLQRTF
ncbi:porin [Ochrobactrum sp. MYb379]|uniref:porin n=1 Tax=Ochrobactrum sp. MYb379 TaxID=2745275 RepID=UPI0030A5E8F0